MTNLVKNETNSAPNTLRKLLEQRTAATPEKVFLFSEPDGRRFTYSAFDLAVNRAASLLKEYGIGKGDVVSLLMPNSVEYIIAYFACWTLGAVAGPVNSLLKENEIAFVLNNSETKALLVHSEFQARIEKIRGDLPYLRSVITFDDEAQATLECEEREKSGRDVRAPSIDKDDDAIIIYTSGTT